MDERESPKGALKMVSSGAMYALSFTTLLYYAVRVANLNFPPPQFISIIILYSFVCYSRSNVPHGSPNSTWCRSKVQEMTNWILRNSPSKRTQWGQGSAKSGCYHGCSRGACQKAEILSMQVNLPPWLTLRPFNKSFAICSPFQTLLVIDQGPDTSSSWATMYSNHKGVERNVPTEIKTEIKFASVTNVGGVLEGYGWGIKEATQKKTRTV